MKKALPGLPQGARPDVKKALRAAIAEPLFELGMAYFPDDVLRALPELILEVRKRWPEDRRPIPAGVQEYGTPVSDKFAPAPASVEACGDALIEAIIKVAIDEHGPLQHKSVLLHCAIVQAINASMRRTGAMSQQGYVDGIANGVAQMLAITKPDENLALFLEALPKIFPTWKAAGLGAGINWDDTKGSA